MALRYDFDIGTVTPAGLPEGFGDLQTTGVSSEARAMFRDPQTVAALKQADPTVQSLFIESGFALDTYDSGAPPGRYPAREEAARAMIIERLSQNLRHHDVRGANWGGFDFQAFMQALSTSEPIEESLLAPRGNPRPNYDAELRAAREASRRRRGMRQMAFGGLALGLVLLLYVAGQMM